MKKQFILFFLMLLPLFAQAEPVLIDGIYYNLHGTEAEVTNKEGGYESNTSSYISRFIDIPASINDDSGTTYKVTSIGDYAFYKCTKLTSVGIPDGVTSIGKAAFYGCTILQWVNIPNSVNTIGEAAFQICDILPSVIIPDGVTSIGASTFRGCSKLASVTIPSSVTSIGDYAFCLCGLTSVIIPDGVTSIGYAAFYGCDNLKTVTIGNGVTSIGNVAFENCISLTSVTIPNSVTSIGERSFYQCSYLTSITIGNSVTSIGKQAFDCGNLTSVTAFMPTPVEIDKYAFSNRTTATLYVPKDSKSLYENANYWKDFKNIVEVSKKPIDFADSGVKQLCVENWDTNEDGELSYEEAEAVTDLGQVFKGHDDITSFDELQYFTGLTSIGKEAFCECCSLTSITIPNSVTSIGESAFNSCFGLASLTIPNSVTSIGDYAFFECTGLTSITIPNSVTSIGEAAFFACNGLTSITVASGNKVYDSRDNCNAIIETSSNTLVVSCNKTVIPSSVISIGGYAFAGSGLTSITIPNSVTSIGDYAFGASGLTSIAIPNSVTSIGEGAFYECIDLTSVTIGSGVTSIGYGAFYECSGLTSVTIPNSVTSIGDGAFYECDNLTSVTALMPTPVEIDEDAFTNRTNATLYVPKGSKSLYENAAYWKEFNNIVGLLIGNINFADENVKALCVAIWDKNKDGELSYVEAAAVKDLQKVFTCNSDITSFDELQYFTGLTFIRNEAFIDCIGLTSVTIPNNVTSIGSAAFFGCSGLTSVTIPNSVTSIGDHAFYECFSLTSLTIPNSVTSIGKTAFMSCRELTSVTIPGSVTSIGDETFADCCGLTSLTIDNGVTSIGMNAFFGCIGLTSVTIPNSVTSIGVCAFNYCGGLTSVSIGNGVTEIGSSAFQSCISLKDFYCYSQNVPSTESDAFNYTDIQRATLHVPASALKAYKTTAPWSGFWKIVPMGTVPTGLMEVASVPVQVKSHSGVITVEGLDNNTPVTVYTAGGALVGTAIAVNHTATISTRLMPGSVAIVKMGGKKVKMVVR